MLTFITRHPSATPEHFGFILGMLDDEDPRPAREQLDAGYQHGGGWRPVMPERWKMLADDCLKWPGDPPLAPICELWMRDERVVLYRAGIVAIIQRDGSFEVSRMD